MTTISAADKVRPFRTFFRRAGAVYDRRQVLTNIIGRDIKVKYGASFLGYFWSFLEPLLLTAVYYFVFGQVARIGSQNYPLFLITGVLPWLWFTHCVQAGMKGLTRQSGLITKVRVPREVFPLGVVGAKTFEFVVSLLVIAMFALVFRVGPSYLLSYALLAFVLQLILVTGIVMLVSAVNVMVRDLERLTRIILRAGFYLSPVLYPVARVTRSEDIPEWVSVIYQANPMVGLLSMYRAGFFPDYAPTQAQVMVSAGAAVLFFVVGYWTFVRLEPKVLKEL